MAACSPRYRDSERLASDGARSIGFTNLSYHRRMTDTGPHPAKASRYRFSRPDGAEIEIQELDSDDAAEMVARELSKAQDIPVVIERFGHVDWEYVTEADERA
jgi:hypothetical protein